MLKNCPDPVDEQQIHFKLHCRLRIFENKNLDPFHIPHSLIACASRYGLLFVGTNTGILQVIQSSSLENYSPKDKDISDYPHRDITLPSSPKHISVNCDSTVLVIVFEQDKCPVAVFYEVLSFYKQNIQTLSTVRLSSNPGTYVTEINWNPAIPSFFTACKSDGSLGIYELKDKSVEINEIPPAAEVSAFCWSPKGKQIAVGSKKGTITQYKPDLKAVRMINAPPLSEPISLISLQWISNYQFMGVYQPTADDAQAKLIVVDAPKSGEIIYTNYDDVCYSGSSRKPQFFMILQQHWNILMVASSNSAELAVLGLISPDCWTQWLISDSSRAELPLSADRQETLPIGLSLDISNTKPYPWGESTIAPCPYILMLSHHGILCVFDLVNLKNVPSICAVPDPIQDHSGLNLFISKPADLLTAQKEVSLAPSSTDTQKKPQADVQVPFQVKQPVSLISQSNPINFAMSTPQVTQDLTLGKKLVTFTPTTAPQTQPTLLEEKQPQSLFGGQSNMTPIKPPTATQSFFDHISITPINKNPPASSAKSNFADDKYSSIFSSLSAQQSSSSVPVQVKPIVISATKTSEKKSQISTPTGSKSEVSVPSRQPDVPGTAKGDNTMSKVHPSVNVKSTPEISKIDTEAILQKMINEECISLEKELKAVIHKGKLINVNLGSDADKNYMTDVIKNLEDFLEEISEISKGEQSEIHILKQNLVLSWAWYEEALSRYNTSKNEMMRLLVKSQPLDSATEKRYSDIKKIMYYIESQLSQVSRALDEQWNKFQDFVKKTYKVQMPTMETIYQAMVRQSAVLQKQGYIMKDISNQLKQKRRSNGGPLLLSLDTLHLEDELKRLQLDHDDIKYGIYDKAQMKKLSSTKSKKLQILVKNREVVHITTVKQFVPSETFQSPIKRLSLLGAKMSPVSKLIEPKKIEFSQSTPVRDPKLTVLPCDCTPALTTLKPLNFASSSSKAKDIITPVSKTATSLSFTPATSSHIISNNPSSAFAPTTQGTKEKASAFSAPLSSVQKTQSQFMFKPSFVPEKPMPSVPNTDFSTKPSIPAFSFITSVSTPTTSSVGNLFTSPTKPSDTTLFPNTISEPCPTTTLVTQTNIKTYVTTSSVKSDVSTTTQSCKPFTGFSIPVQTVGSTQLATINVSTNATVTSVSSVVTTTSTTFSFLSKTVPTTVLNPTNMPVSSSFGSLAKSTTSSSTSGVITTTSTTFSFLSKPVPTTVQNLTSPIVSSSFGSLARSTTLSSSTTFVGTTTSITPSLSFANLNTKVATSNSPVSIPSSPLFGLKTPTSEISTSSLATTTSSIITSNISNVSTAVTPSSSGVVTNATILSSTPSVGLIGSGSPSIFVPVSTSSTTTLFGSKPSPVSLFGATTTTTVSSTLFGTNVSVQSPSTLFSGLTSTATTTMPSSSIFGSTSLFGANTTVTSSTSIFSSSNSNVDTASKPSSTSVFGSSSTPLFGSSSTTSLFSNTSKSDDTTKPSSPSIFGSTPVCQTTSIFGQPSSISTTKSIFGGTTTSPKTEMFGSTPAPVTQGSLFGQTNQSSIFGSSVTTTTVTQPSVFGTAASVAKPVFGSSTSGTSIFASVTTASAAAFGPAPTNAFGSGFSGSGFSSPLSTSASIFGQQTPTFGANSGSIFGGTQTTTTGSIFGAVSSSGSLFGTPSSSTFSFASAPGASGEGALNFGGLNVGGTPTTAGSIFGEGGSTFGTPTAAPNPFGSAPEKSAFGGGGNLFGTPVTTASVFGSNTSFGTNNPSQTFGSTSFGSPGFGQQQQPGFGQSTFGTPSFGSAQPGPFSGGTASVGQSGFGSPSSFQKPASAFGGAPVFGSSAATPAFGGSPSFGGAPAFGAAPAFGSPTKVFGSNTASAAFGSATAGSPGFGNLANQNTIGFGNLAKQASDSPSTAFSGNSSFSSWR